MSVCLPKETEGKSEGRSQSAETGNATFGQSGHCAILDQLHAAEIDEVTESLIR